MTGRLAYHVGVVVWWLVVTVVVEALGLWKGGVL